MAGFIPAIHFPEAIYILHRLWKMDGRHEGGHDENSFVHRANFHASPAGAVP